MHEPSSPNVTGLAASALSILATIGVAALIIRGGTGPVPTGAATVIDVGGAASLPRGTSARITAGDVTVERTLPALDFALRPGQTLDPRLPVGSFRAVFTVVFTPAHPRARLGAEIAGGSLIIRRRGEVLLSDYAGPGESRTVLSREAVYLGTRPTSVEIEYVRDGDAACRLRPLWQPETATAPLPLPSHGAPLVDDRALAGLVVAQEHGCARCHVAADDALQARLLAAPAPDLSRAGARLRPGWVRKWIVDPSVLRDGARMPLLVLDVGAGSTTLADLTAFVTTRGGPLPPESEDPVEAGAVATGRVLYHDVGCVACHGPLDEPVQTRFDPLGDIASKTTTAALASFLLDPVALHPSGHMPGMVLEDDEAAAIATYLMNRDGTPTPVPATRPDPSAVERGRAAFGRLGCAACHEGVVDDAPAPAAPALADLADVDLADSCVDGPPHPGRPRFDLSDRDRTALGAFLAGLPARRSEDVPHDRVAATMSRLNCSACHAIPGTLGPKPEAASRFRTIGEADLGDEGRLPPDLTDVGARLRPNWIRRVIEDAERARPYLSARMPQFGASVAHLVADLPAVAGVAGPAEEPTFSVEAAESGRFLVGAQGFNCIQCHDIAGRPSTGTPGPDLVAMVERLRYDAFARWLADPSLMRPGTRMPSFFVNGRSGFTEHFGGRAEDQIAAIWSYLSQGELLPLPEGLVDPAGLMLEVVDRPIVFRTFMASAGVRAIACGFPAQVHCAFDADRCRLAAAWTGPFLNASGAWASRGGSETNPPELAWEAPDEPLLTAGDGTLLTPTFHGYRLDDDGGPVFLYTLSGPGVRVDVEDRPRPAPGGASARALRRTLRLTAPEGAALRLSTAAATPIPVDDADVTGDAPSRRIEVAPGTPTILEVEVRW